MCSVGVIPHHLPFVKSNNAIRTFRHAISLDEHRANFQANHWHNDSKDAECTDEHYCDHENGRCVNLKTDVKEVWFAGCHKGAYLLQILHIIMCQRKSAHSVQVR